MRFFLLLVLAAFAMQASGLEQLRRDFANPPVDARPHTRWWWMGNSLRNQDIDFQLDQMQKAGIGGVEQISMEEVYERGNVEFLSGEYFARIKHAIAEAKRRGMEFSLNFGGPGWIWGGDWVPKADRNKNMVASMIELRGPRAFSGELPLDVVQNPRNLTQSLGRIRPEDRVLAVVAGQTEDLRL
ncbi:MAG: glycosyl hydrolase, partial [Bryobacteraceae bacterium]